MQRHESEEDAHASGDLAPRAQGNGDESVLQSALQELMAAVERDAAGALVIVELFCKLLRAANAAGAYPEEEKPSADLSARHAKAKKRLQAAKRPGDPSSPAAINEAQVDLVAFRVLSALPSPVRLP